MGAKRVARHADAPASLLTVGSLIPRKGLDQLLDGLAAASSNCTLDVVGEGPEEAALRQRCEALGLAHRVRFEGAIAPDALPDRLASGDVFVLTSHSEGRPNVVLEAMRAGLPLVTLAHQGVGEITTDETAARVRPVGLRATAKALSDAIRGLAEDRPRRVGRGLAGHRRVQRHYRWRERADEIDRLYQSLVA